MFWAVTLSSASSIFLAKKVLEAGRYGEGNLRLNVSQCSHWRLPGYQWSTPSAFDSKALTGQVLLAGQR